MNTLHDIDLVYVNKLNQKFYLGGMPEIYKDLNVHVVINCVAEIPINYDGLEILQIPFLDSVWPKAQPTSDELNRWLKAMHCIIDHRDVLVHCHAGMNRSALILVLYLWHYHKEEFLNKQELINIISSKRSPILENKFFQKIIQEW